MDKVDKDCFIHFLTIFKIVINGLFLYLKDNLVNHHLDWFLF